MTEEKIVFEIVAENLDAFQKAMKKLSRKSEKLIGEPINPVPFGFKDKKINGVTRRVYEFLLTAENPVVDGWSFVARLDHSQDTGTIIREVPGMEVPEKYRHASHTNCDHCGVQRFRRDTFVLFNAETGKFQQIGRTCLKDFFGHDVKKIAEYYELVLKAIETGRNSEREMGRDLRFVNVHEYLSHCAAFVRENGDFVSRKMVQNSENLDLMTTGDEALTHITNPRYRADVSVNSEDEIMAQNAIDWAAGIEAKNTYQHNIKTIAQDTMVGFHQLNLTASILGAYLRENTQTEDDSIISQLSANIHKLSMKDADFAESLIESVKQRGGATEKQEYWLKVLLDRANGKAPEKIGSIQRIVELMNTNNAKRAAILLDTGEDTIRVSKAGSSSVNKGCLYVKTKSNDEYMGKITPDGKFIGKGAANTAIMNVLKAFADNPAKVASEYGKSTGCCCFCSRELTDPRSIEVGYGPICASHYGLEWGDA